MTIGRVTRVGVGLIFGEYITGSFWAIMGCLTGLQAYRVLPK